jgi:apoptosis-stimulating of p53 protein 1
LKVYGEDAAGRGGEEEGKERGVDDEENDNGTRTRATTRSALKKLPGGGKLSRRVSFDPLALLLDAALEGEVELVKKCAAQAPAAAAASNDEGITALHNAVCAGHLDIVKFLVEFGCDVNSQDSDGWYVTAFFFCVFMSF